MAGRWLAWLGVLVSAWAMLDWAATPVLAQGAAGVVVDAEGVLRLQVTDQAVTRDRLAAARAGLNPDVARPSALRKVSLTRLEKLLANGAPLTGDMQHLAGLTAVTHVFFFPETKDVVLAGPAEGFLHDATGRAIGLDSGRAVVLLEDVVVALRAFGPTGQRANVISVSIDPTADGLLRMQQFLTQVAGRARPGDAARIVEGLKQNLGLQNVTVRGVSPQSHFAQVLVEADYRMKLIGIGIEPPPVKITSYVQRANPRDVSRNAMQRWYFTPNYECVRVSDDGFAMQLVGDGVKLIGENELVTAQGGRVAAAGVNAASDAFVAEFTKKYPELAARSPVYAQMKNLIDLAIAAAFIQEHDWYGAADWRMEYFGDERRFPVETHPTPRQVESACTAIWKGNTLMTPIGGGVHIQARQALATDRLLNDDDGQLAATRQGVSLDRLAPDQWWWD